MSIFAERAPDPLCIGCLRTPGQIEEYVEAARETAADTGIHFTPEEWVRQEEGTYNDRNGHFACTTCYIRMGMPSTLQGWVAP